MAHGCSQSACYTSTGWTNAHYHDGPGEADAAGPGRRDWNGRWICPALRTAGRCGLVSGYVYRVGVGRGTSHDNRRLYNRVRTSSPHEQPDCGVLILEREWSGSDGTKSDGFRTL